MKRIRECATIILVAPAILLPSRLPFFGKAPIVSVAHAEEGTAMSNQVKVRGEDNRLKNLRPILVEQYSIGLERQVRSNLLAEWERVDPVSGRSALIRPGAARVHDDRESEVRSAQNALDILAKIGALGDIHSLEVTGRMNDQTREAIRRARTFFHVVTPPNQRDDLFDAPLVRAIIDSLNNATSELRTRMAQAASFRSTITALQATPRPARTEVPLPPPQQAIPSPVVDATRVSESEVANLRGEAINSLREIAFDQQEQQRLYELFNQAEPHTRNRRFDEAANLYTEIKIRSDFLRRLHFAERLIAENRLDNSMQRDTPTPGQLRLAYGGIIEARDSGVTRARADYNNLLDQLNMLHAEITRVMGERRTHVAAAESARQLPTREAGAPAPHTVTTGDREEERVRPRPTARLEDLAPTVPPEVHAELQARAAAGGSRRRAEGRDVETPAPAPAPVVAAPTPAQAQNTRPETRDAGRETPRPAVVQAPSPASAATTRPAAAALASVSGEVQNIEQQARAAVSRLDHTINRLFELGILHGNLEGEGWRPNDVEARRIIRTFNTVNRYLRGERYRPAVRECIELEISLRTQIDQLVAIEQLAARTLERLNIIEGRMNARIAEIQPIALMIETRNLPSRWQAMLGAARTQHGARDYANANTTLDTLEQELGRQVPEETIAQNRANANAIMDQIRALRNAREVVIPLDEGERRITLNQNARGAIGELVDALEQRWLGVDGSRNIDEDGMHAALELYAEITRDGSNILESLRRIGGARALIDERTAHHVERTNAFTAVSARLAEQQRNDYHTLLDAFRQRLTELERGGAGENAQQSGFINMRDLYDTRNYTGTNTAFASVYRGIRLLTDLPPVPVPQPVEAPAEFAIEYSASTINVLRAGVVSCNVVMFDEGRQVSLEQYNMTHPDASIAISAWVYIIRNGNYIVNPNKQERVEREFVAEIRGSDVYRVEYRNGRRRTTNEKIAELTPEGTLTYESQNNPEVRRMLGIRRRENTFDVRSEYPEATRVRVRAFPLFR